MNKYWLPPTERKDILDFSLDQATREGADLWEGWKLIEAKAQATLATAGIFEAGAFAYITQANGMHWTVSSLLIMIVIVLAGSVHAGVQSIQIRNTDTPYPGRVLHESILYGLDNAEPTESLALRLETLVKEATERAATANEKVRSALESKASKLFRSQIMLMVAAWLVVFLAIASLSTKP